MADRLINRGVEGSREWVRAWLMRWGRKVADLTAQDPTYVPMYVGREGGTFAEIGPDRVPQDVYREWRDVQDGSRKIRGDKHGRVVWED